MAKRFLILSNRVGTGDAELGGILMRNLLYTLARSADKPAAVAFMNEGVRLACEGSTSLDDLRLLTESGVAVTSCGTCLSHLGLGDSLAVGTVGDIAGAVDGMMSDAATVTIA